MSGEEVRGGRCEACEAAAGLELDRFDDLLARAEKAEAERDDVVASHKAQAESFLAYVRIQTLFQEGLQVRLRELKALVDPKEAMRDRMHFAVIGCATGVVVVSLGCWLLL